MDHEKEVERHEWRYSFSYIIPRALAPYDFRTNPCYRRCWECGEKFLMLTREQKYCVKKFECAMKQGEELLGVTP